jgi:hypothetical protein
MFPAVTEVVFVEDEDRRIIGDVEVAEANVAGFEDLTIGPAVLIDLRS